jgi:hypothetical protein
VNVSDSAGAAGPRVFLSFAGPDRLVAERLRGDLAAEGFDAFIDVCSLALSESLTDSSYYVLLWSRHTDNRP